MRRLAILLAAAMISFPAAAFSQSQTQGSSTLSGTSASIGGAALAAGACTTGTATVSGAALGMAAIANPTTGTTPGDSFTFDAFVSAANTVTVRVCNRAGLGTTPAASTYAVRVVR